MIPNRWTALLVALLSTLSLPLSTCGQGPAFTYQGRLNSSGDPANGSYDLTIALFSVGSGSGPVGSTQTNPATAVSNGLFTVALDFDANFPGADRWLEIGTPSTAAVARAPAAWIPSSVDSGLCPLRSKLPMLP